MKKVMRVKLERPDPKFLKIAAIIAKSDPPPEWLALGLQHFSLSIAEEVTPEERKRFEAVIANMRDRIDYLIKWLPLFRNLPAGVQCPDDVAIALDVLPRISADLASAQRRRKWKWGHKFCAAVVVEAWQLVHGRVERRSDRLYSACEEYWKACDRGDRDIDNWRRDVADIGPEYAWLREVLSALRGTQSPND
jgi:hypothetical protein